MRQTLPSIFLIVSCFINLAKADNFPSPDKKFVVSTSPRDNGTGCDIWVSPSSDTDHKKQIDGSERWVEIKWADDSKYFAVINHTDGHTTNIEIFGILCSPQNNYWNICPVYYTPWPTAYNRHWELLKWNLSDGTVLLKCRFADIHDVVLETEPWYKRTFLIPIDCKPPANKTEQGAAANP